MKVLSITAQKPDSTGSGIFLGELVKGFAKRGAKQAVIGGIYQEDKPEFVNDIMFYPVYFESEQLPFPIAGMSDEMPYRSTKYSEMNEVQVERFQKAFMNRICQVVNEFQPDVILCHHLYLLTAFVRAAFPEIFIIGVSHGSDLRQLKKNPLHRKFIITQVQKLDGILALHDEQRQDIAATFGYDVNRIAVTGVGYNEQIFYSFYNKKNDDKKELIFAGKISEKKGVKSLFRCLEHLSFSSGELTIKLAGGSGAEEEYGEIVRLAQECKYKVEFLGILTQKELAEEFNAGDVFVLPSFYEGLPLVIAEALACNLEVVATDLPGIRDWLDANAPGNQILFVTPPKMQNTDEPMDGELPVFEKRLAQMIESALCKKNNKTVDLSGLTWNGVAGKVMNQIVRWKKL